MVDVLFTTALGWVAAGIVAVLLAVAWVAVPLWRRARTEMDDPDENDV